MGTAIARLRAAMAVVRDGLDDALNDVVSVDDANGLLCELEVLGRQVAGLQVDAMAAVDRAGLHAVDGHSSVRVMARHVGKLSGATAGGRVKIMAMLAQLPGVADGFRSGQIGVDQAALLGRVYANPRVRDAMAERDHWFVLQAKRLSYKEFEMVVRLWERLADEDGPEPVNSRTHENRDASLVQNSFDLSWELSGVLAAFEGAAMREIFDRYLQAELEADWDKAKANYGPDACYTDLARTEPQRRADAVTQIFRDAAGSEDGAVPPGFVHNIVWDAASFEEMVARLDPDHEPPHVSQGLDVDHFRCETVDGTPLEPAEAVVNATVSAVRRVVVDAKGVTIDLGRARLFTRAARHAVMLADTHCVWPGCDVPASRCEIDHLTGHAQGGPTNPTNGAVMCGRHNRWKQKGYTLHRDQTGNWHTYRPDRTKIP